jgi:hypothetical protein
VVDDHGVGGRAERRRRRRGGCTSRRTDVPGAGDYSFPIGGGEEGGGGGDDDVPWGGAAVVPPGRYYVMYKAPRGYRIGGNVLPVDRRPPATASGAEGGGEEEFECIPRGGKGLGYAVEAFTSGAGCCAAAAAVVAAWARTPSSL